jgi:CBS domain-containing protein
VADQLERLGEFSEQGRGVPVTLSRPGGALPFSPLVRQAYAPAPRARIGWAQGVIRVADVTIDAPCAVAPDETLSRVAACLRDDEAGFVPIVSGRRFVGVVWLDDLLAAVADGRNLPDVRSLVSAQIPTCAPESVLVDAVRQMIACWLRRIPVVGDGGELVGVLALATAAQAGERDPAVRDVLEAANTPALFARRWK